MSTLLRVAIGEVLRQERTGCRMTLRDVAAEANMSLGYLSELERGLKDPSSEMLAVLCEALGITMKELLAEVMCRV